MHVLPKRIFSGEEEIGQLRQLLRRVPLPAASQTVPEQENFHLAYSITADDFAHAYTEITRIIRTRHTYLFSMPCLGFMLFAYFYLRTVIIYAPDLAMMGGGIVFLIYLFFKLKDINVKRYQRLILSDRLAFKGVGTWDITLQTNCINLQHNTKSYQYPWNLYHYLFETTDTFYLVQGEGKRPQEFTIFPKWAFESQEQLNAFLSCCEQMGIGKYFYRIYEIEQAEKAAVIRVIRDTLLITVTLLLLFSGVAGSLLNYLLPL